MGRLLGRLPERWQWVAHNTLGHPLLALLTLLGCARAGRWVHDVTVPDEP